MPSSACRMRFLADGSLTFEGGFEDFSPSSWSLGSEGLLITLGGTVSFAGVARVAQYQLINRRGSLLSFDRETRELLYPFSYCTVKLDFAGYYFFREPPTGCP